MSFSLRQPLGPEDFGFFGIALSSSEKPLFELDFLFHQIIKIRSTRTINSLSI